MRKEKKKTRRRRRRRKAHSQKVGLAATALLCAKNSKKFIPPPPPLFERVGRGIQSYPSSSSSAIPFAYFFLLEPFSTSPDLSRKKIPPTYARKERDKGDLLASPKIKRSREATPGDFKHHPCFFYLEKEALHSIYPLLLRAKVLVGMQRGRKPELPAHLIPHVHNLVETGAKPPSWVRGSSSDEGIWWSLHLRREKKI